MLFKQFCILDSQKGCPFLRKENSIMFNRKLIQAVPETRPIMMKQVAFQVLGMLCAVLCSLVLCSMAVTLFQQPDTAFNQLALNILLLLIGCLGKIWSARKASQCALQSSLVVKKSLRYQLFDKLAQIGPGYATRWSTAELSQLMSEGIQQVETYFAQYIPQFFYALIAPVLLFVITVFWDWKAALALLVAVPLIPASIVAVQKFAKKLLAKYWDQYTGLSDSFLENLQGLTTLKVYRADEARHQKMNEEAEQFRRMTMRVLIMQLNSISVMDAVAYGGTAIGTLLALISYAHSNLSLFHMLGFILLSAEFFLPMRLLGSYFHISMNGSAAADRIFRVLETPTQDGVLTIGSLKENEALLEGENLSYCYPASTGRDATQALDNIQFAFAPTGFFGIAGESGSGKTTLSRLLQKELDDYHGSLQVNNQEISQIRREDLLQTVTVSAYDSTLFAGTIRDNLLAADPKATEEEMIQVLQEVRLWKTLEAKDGLDTVLSEKGQNFSGGQRQRLSLARALLKKSSILLLDEATSSMDVLTENAVMDLLRQKAKERLIVVISHRLANLQKADAILVLKDGKQQGFGSHEQLLKDSAEYQKLWQAQKRLEAYAQNSEEEEA